jgi:SAM-dependent methyltransferase
MSQAYALMDRDDLTRIQEERVIAWNKKEREGVETCQKWYDDSYSKNGFNAQRRYPNEELLRFVGRNYFHLPIEQRKSIRVLEVGCGSGANLWMLAKEGFEVHGVDLSSAGIGLCVQMLGSWGAQGNLKVGDMTKLEYPDKYFDVIVDVFSSYCLDERCFSQFMNQVERLLKPAGKFFSYTPSKGSDVFKRTVERQFQTDETLMIDRSTLNGISGDRVPFSGNRYPFRFISCDEMSMDLEIRGMCVKSLERVGRTYNEGKDYFEFVVVEGEK